MEIIFPGLSTRPLERSIEFSFVNKLTETNLASFAQQMSNKKQPFSKKFRKELFFLPNLIYFLSIAFQYMMLSVMLAQE